MSADHVDFVLYGRRTSPDSIQVLVRESPAGAMSAPATVSFPESEAQALQQSFRLGLAGNALGRAQITQGEANEIGARLAEVVFPPPVFRLLAQSLAQVVHRGAGGLRIRLALDPSLVDLPWEYVHRPDRPDSSGVSGFLLLDPKISLVREAAHPLISLQPLTGRQRLAFIGTFWEGDEDRWDVRTEFERLRTALAPVSEYISPVFARADTAFERGIEGAAILHYAGHCDFDAEGRPFLILQMPTTGRLKASQKLYLSDLAKAVSGGSVRLVVLSACNGGYWPMVQPLLDAGVPAVIGLNGAVASLTSIEFCAKIYESLAVGLTLDEAVGRARLHVLEWDRHMQLFDWGLFMVYMRSPQSVLFPRLPCRSVGAHQRQVRRDHQAVAAGAIQGARELDGMNFAEIMSDLTQRRVLILGRFTGRRLAILEAMKARLAQHPQGYQPELFTFAKPKSRDLVESIIGFASLSRFIIADLSEPKSVQSELQAIVPQFPSVPVAPVINRTGKEYATFSNILRRENVVQPTLRYRDRDDLLAKLDEVVVPQAEAKLREVQPKGRE